MYLFYPLLIDLIALSFKASNNIWFALPIELHVLGSSRFFENIIYFYFYA